MRAVKLLTFGGIHHPCATIGPDCHVSHVGVGSMSWNKSLGLGRYGREDAILLETLTI
jgi:hypothetical protein